MSDLLPEFAIDPVHFSPDVYVKAYKKYLIGSLILEGKFTLPKCDSALAPKNLQTLCEPYIEVVNCYNEGQISKLKAVVEANRSCFEKDENFELVMQAVAYLYMRMILRLNEKYLTLSLEEIANKLQLATAKDAEVLVRLMIQDGQLRPASFDEVSRSLLSKEIWNVSRDILCWEACVDHLVGPALKQLADICWAIPMVRQFECNLKMVGKLDIDKSLSIQGLVNAVPRALLDTYGATGNIWFVAEFLKTWFIRLIAEKKH